MGSYGDSWIRCFWCSKWGQCKSVVPEPYASLLDVDGVGVICIPCYNRCCPPHYYYLFKLLGVEWSAAVDIANYTYPICAQTAIDWESDPDATGEMGVEDLFLYLDHGDALDAAGCGMVCCR